VRIFLNNDTIHQNISVVSTKQISVNDFQISLRLNEEQEIYQYFIRKLNNQYFFSKDSITWKKTTEFVAFENVFIQNQLLDIHMGFMAKNSNENSGNSLISKMPGKVIKILKAAGQQVVKGEGLLIIEAMKMENEIKASVDGKIKTIHVIEGQNIDSGLLLISIEE